MRRCKAFAPSCSAKPLKETKVFQKGSTPARTDRLYDAVHASKIGLVDLTNNATTSVSKYTLEYLFY
jgi:hypothetical protein